MAVAIVPLVLSGGFLWAALGSSCCGVSRRPSLEELESDLDATALGNEFEGFGHDPLVVSEAASSYILEAPYKTFLRMEPTDVPDHMLLAILLAGSTRRSPVDVAFQLLQGVGGDVSLLERSSVWQNVEGVGDSGHARIMAAAELARRAQYRQAMTQRAVIDSPESAMEVLRTLVVGPYEKLAAIYLDRKRRVIGSRLLTVGSAGFTIVDPSQVLRPAVELGASALILAHQHPSGSATPSEQDYLVTERVVEGAKMLGINLLDHLVIGAQGRWSSLAELGKMPSSWSKPMEMIY
jgi:DNA repair protein RadC